jgi:hypothetical protein
VQAIQDGAEHVVIHLPSLSIEEHLRLSIPDLAQRQNLQLSRMFQCVQNRNVTVVYISPVLLPDEVRPSLKGWQRLVTTIQYGDFFKWFKW